MPRVSGIRPRPSIQSRDADEGRGGGNANIACWCMVELGILAGWLRRLDTGPFGDGPGLEALAREGLHSQQLLVPLRTLRRLVGGSGVSIR